MGGFTLEVLHLDGSVTVELVGELDLATVETLDHGLSALGSRYDAEQLTIDCSRLDFVGATGLTSLLALTRRMAGGRPTLRHPPPTLRRILAITGTEDRFVLDQKVSV